MHKPEVLYPTTAPPPHFPNEVGEAAYIVKGYLEGFNPPFDGWHHIDNADGDLLREVIKQLVRHIYNEREPMREVKITVSDSEDLDMFRRETHEDHD